ncbi:CAP domain-containing protein [Luteolibacter flavescens]|uniref:CAP domain-containing protein n=1 Tax=Luteolibacter flavescens TaxID=1859460 RepID=A0ABT3FR09_9BACT|nr:CAP domain-containing protein [Luteolibacter flavescens]MCW1885734.1 CAP domain-containing protein [Luteolibacter flavescens]
MKVISYHTLTTAAAALLLASCGPKLDSTTVLMSTVPVTKSDGSLAGTIHSQVNSYRQSKGREVLQRHAGLDRMAQQHSEFMRRNRGKFSGKNAAANISHYGFEERALNAQRTMKMSNVAENIATCSGSHSSAANTLVGAWKNSSSHDKNMRGKWSTTGIGVVVDKDGTVFATQLFATESHSHMALTDRMRQF